MKEFIMSYSEVEIATLYVCNDVDMVCSENDILEKVNAFLADMQTGIALSKLNAYTNPEHWCNATKSRVTVSFDPTINEFTIKVIKYVPYITEFKPDLQ